MFKQSKTSFKLNLVSHSSLQKLINKLSNLTAISQIYIAKIKPGSYYQIGVRSADGLRFYDYQVRTGDWVELFFDNRFSDANSFNKVCYALSFWKTSFFDQELLIFRDDDGLIISSYNEEKNKFEELIKPHNLFSDSYGWDKAENQFKLGYYFYGEKEKLGLFTNYFGNDVKFYCLFGEQKEAQQIELDFYDSDDLQDNAWKKQKEQEIEWNKLTNYFYFADIKNNSATQIVRQDEEGLHFYEYSLEKLPFKRFLFTQIGSGKLGFQPQLHHLWFAKLTDNLYLNLITWQADGLRVYAYNEEKKRLFLY